jgi:hypothetical protein
MQDKKPHYQTGGDEAASENRQATAPEIAQICVNHEIEASL